MHPHGVQIRHFMGCTGATYPIRDPISRVRSCCRTRTRSLLRNNQLRGNHSGTISQLPAAHGKVGEVNTINASFARP